jgi:hypothetical protein
MIDVEASLDNHPLTASSRIEFNPADFGAVGDGIVDDSTAMQALLDNLAAARGGKLRLPARKFRLSQPLRIRSKSISIDGGANGFSNSPAAEHESRTGSEIFAESDAIEIGLHDPADIANAFTKLGALNLRNLYLWGPGVYSGKKAFYFNNHVDQSQFDNIHIGNFQWGMYSDTVLDDPTFSALDIIHCLHGIYLSEKSLAAYVKIHNCTIADNDGIGIYIHPDSNSFCCQLMNCVIVRNARTPIQDGCNVYWGARESIIANNIIHAAGYHFYNEAVLGCQDNHVEAGGLIITGSDNLVTGNQVLDHAMGTGVVISGHRNQIIHNAFTGRIGSSQGQGSGTEALCRNRLDIHILRGARDTTVVQSGQFTLQDEGIRTIVNGTGKNEGDPDAAGDWKDAAKPDGLVIHDFQNEITWMYGQQYPERRIMLHKGSAAACE